jgi:AcrR family transcriptional regulator
MPRTAHHQDRRERRVSARLPARQRIISGGRRHFLAHGFRSVTMDDLAAELGMSKKTLYATFSSKTALLEAVLLDKFQEVETDLGRITSHRSGDVLTALHDLLACVQRHTEEIQPAFLRDIRRETPDLFKIVETRRAGLIQRYFGKLLGEGRKSGIIRRDVPVRLIMEILLGATQAIMNPAKMADLDLTPKAGYTAIIRVVLEGAITKEAKG